MNEQQFHAASAWAEEMGAEHVITDAARCAEAGACTFAISREVRGILRPGSVAEVQACIRIANAHRVPLYAVSTGKNWGLGSRVPTADGCVILDLARLNRIVDFNEDLAYITVEPGVTFKQAFEFLTERKSRLYLSAIGGPDTASLIGNAVDRGDGVGPNSDRALHACAMEIVLPDGEIVKTGFARHEETRMAPLARFGIGPSLDGLFSQSNLGVVTQMTFWLAPMPDHFAVVHASIADTAALSCVIEALRPLLLRDIIRPGCISIWNAYKVLAFNGRYPWTVTGGRTPFSLACSTKKGAEPWYLRGTLLAWSTEQARALSGLVKQALAPHCASLALTESEADSPAGARTFPLGIPSPANVRSAYWRKKTDIPDDLHPDRDRCGVLWLCPSIPFDGAQVASAMSAFETIFRAHGFEPNLAMSPATARSFHVYLAIMYDRDVSGEDARALACHDELLQHALQDGYIPFRLGVQSMTQVPAGDARYVQLLRQLKQTLDPNDVLAPGRYDWRHEWPPE